MWVRYESIAMVKEEQFDTVKNFSRETVINNKLFLKAATLHKRWQILWLRPV